MVEKSEPVVLSRKEIAALRARAHALKPVVWIAPSGVSEGLVKELERALTAHELVKVHAALDDRQERARVLETLCAQAGAHAVQSIGKMLVIFRPQPVATQATPAAAKPARKAARRRPQALRPKPRAAKRQRKTSAHSKRR